LRAHSPLLGAFQVHDPVDARVDGRDVVGAARLDEHGAARVAEARHQGVDPLLQKRFAARDLDQPAWVLHYFCEDFVDRAPFALVKGVFGVAVGAAQIAAGEPDEDTGLPGKGALALDAVENLIDGERAGQGLGRRGGLICCNRGAHHGQYTIRRGVLKQDYAAGQFLTGLTGLGEAE
jgi:hypothetical protein